MNIIIMGAGKVGFHIAEILSKEGHDITIIENIPEREEYAREKIDALVLYGHGASEKVLKKAGIANADMLVAVTDRDEVNILACMVAKEYGVKTKIARIRDKAYCQTEGKLPPEELGIDFLINPREVVAQEICNKVTYLKATDVTEFANGQVVFISYLITYDSPIAEFSIRDLVAKRSDFKMVIMSIYRKEEILTPSGDDVIKVGDIVSVVTKKKNMNSLRKLFGFKTGQSRNIFILGAGDVGIEVAERLSKNHNIKILDKDPKKCEIVSEKLGNALVFCSDNTDADTLKAEGIANSDVFIAVTNDDQSNILGAQLAKYAGVKRSIAVVNKPDLTKLAVKLRVDACVSPRMATASAVLRYIRGDKVFSVSRLEQSNSEVIEFEIPEDSAIAGKAIRNVNIPKGIIVGAITRGEDIIIPSGDDTIEEGDHVIVLSLEESIAKAEKFFS